MLQLPNNYIAQILEKKNISYTDLPSTEDASDI